MIMYNMYTNKMTNIILNIRKTTKYFLWIKKKHKVYSIHQKKIDQRCGYLNIVQYYIMEKWIYYVSIV